MGFYARMPVKRSTPAKLYVHETGIDMFGVAPWIEARVQFERDIDTFDQLMSWTRPSFFLGIVWGDEKYDRKVTEIFGFSDLKKRWRGNPGVASWTVRNGVYLGGGPLTCGDGLIMLGAEERFRKTTSSLQEYISCAPLLSVPVKHDFYKVLEKEVSLGVPWS